jgi:hypothetical protein
MSSVTKWAVPGSSTATQGNRFLTPGIEGIAFSVFHNAGAGDEQWAVIADNNFWFCHKGVS